MEIGGNIHVVDQDVESAFEWLNKENKQLKAENAVLKQEGDTIWSVTVTGRGPFRIELHRNRRWKGQIGFSRNKNYADKMAHRYAKELSITLKGGD